MLERASLQESPGLPLPRRGTRSSILDTNLDRVIRPRQLRGIPYVRFVAVAWMTLEPGRLGRLHEELVIAVREWSAVEATDKAALRRRHVACGRQREQMLARRFVAAA